MVQNKEFNLFRFFIHTLELKSWPFEVSNGQPPSISIAELPWEQ